MAGGVYEIGVLYEALAEGRGWTPQQVDEMELWECAVALGVLKADKDEQGGGSNDRLQGHKYDVMRQRMAAERGEGPMPEARPVTPDQIQRVGESMP